MMKKLCHTGAPTGKSVGSSTEFFKDIHTVWDYVVHSIQNSQDGADKETCYDENKRKFVPLLNEVQSDSVARGPNVNVDTLEKVLQNLEKRIQVCLDVKGDQFRHPL